MASKKRNQDKTQQLTQETLEAAETPTQEPLEQFDETTPDQISDQEPAKTVDADILEPEPEDDLTRLQSQLEKTQAQAQEYLNDLQRERAAFQNYKKRQENERAQMYEMAQANLLLQLLPVLDDFERALENAPKETCEPDWLQGILLIQRKLKGMLQAAGALPIEAEPGQDFDPFFHEAITYEENAEYAEGQIIARVQQGYKLGERVLRPSLVRVAKS